VVVACSDIPGKATVLDALVVIIEALSESTAERDHGRKRWGYQTIRSLRHYVLVDQDEGGVEVTSPNPDGTWQSVILRDLGDRLELTALEAEIGLKEVRPGRLPRHHRGSGSRGRLLKGTRRLT
jgi:Uma2 family endonuclease